MLTNSWCINLRNWLKYISVFGWRWNCMRERLLQFMSGRNGNDALNRFLLTTDFVLIILSVIFSKSFSRFLMPLIVILLGITYYRMLSRDLVRRSDENYKYLRAKDKMLVHFRLIKERWIQRKEYKFFICPACKATLRVPKGRGKVKIVCRKCGNSFTGKT